jgi:hypothetical protein
MKIRLLALAVLAALSTACVTYHVNGRDWHCDTVPMLGGAVYCASIHPTTGVLEVVPFPR